MSPTDLTLSEEEKRYQLLPDSPSLPSSLSPSYAGAFRDSMRLRSRPVFAAVCGLALLAVCTTIGLSLRHHAAEGCLFWHHPTIEETCSPLAYDQGHWAPRAETVGQLSTLQDVYAAAGVSTCRAEFQPTWNLGLDAQPPYDRLAEKISYVWEPHTSCELREPSMRVKLQALIDRPLLLVGDSRTRQHFFQLSCELAEHVIWRGAKGGTDDNRDLRAWRFEKQHLLLDPASPLFSKLDLPRGFDTEKPLISYVVAYIPISRAEMRELPGVDLSHVPDHPPFPSFPVSELSMNGSIGFFTAPDSHYRTMVFSTGAHFSPAWLLSPTERDLHALLRASLKRYFGELAKAMRSDQHVLVRAAEAGQTNCDQYDEPWDEVDDAGSHYNYAIMRDLNVVTEAETRLLGDSRFSWLGLDRLTRLRPDAHLPGDCIHYSTVSGVYETISRYLWHTLLERH